MSVVQRRLRGGETFFRVRQNGEGLFPGDTREPLQELIDSSAFFEVFEKGFYWHTCALEDPGTANALWVPFDR